MSNISHLHEKLGRVIGFHYEYDHITMRCDYHDQYQLMDSGCRLRAQTVGRRQQRAPPAWESRTSFAPPAFCTFLLQLLFVLLNLFAVMVGLYLQVKQIQRRSILCILLPLNQFMWTECSNDSCIFFLLKNILFLHGLGSNKLHWGFQSFRSNGDSTLHLNKQSRAGLETLPTVFPSCQMQVHLSLLRHERSECEKRREELSNILTQIPWKSRYS